MPDEQSDEGFEFFFKDIIELWVTEQQLYGEIRKYLKMDKFKNFNLGKVDTISVTGDTIIIY